MGLGGLSGLVIGVASRLGEKPLADREKSSLFECGFDPSTEGSLKQNLTYSWPHNEGVSLPSNLGNRFGSKIQNPN